jgi:hypothetical protein
MRALGKFFFEVKEWFADAADHWRLAINDSRLNNLKACLKEEASSFGRREIETEINLYSEFGNEIIVRINEREARHGQAVTQ